ncbi:lysylphosphatidylglycerol synthase domain-containing protein [Thermogladius sp. 4427co]|uniref:lysylphosphatidylglycerol synthase domain-containing protein n=1 Tax=Thermogladius sp. 4427co TaxID=3450718 RepID=UPI003F7927DD
MRPGVALISIVIVFATIAVYSVVTSSYYTIFSSNPLAMAASSTLLLAGYAVSSLRLKIIHYKYTGRRLGFTEYFKARLVGNTLAFITPSAVGGELGRAGYFTIHGYSLAEMLAVSYFDVFFDVLITNIVGLVFSISYLPWSLPVIIVAISTLGIWFSTIVALAVVGNSRGIRFPRAFEKTRLVSRWLHKLADFVNALAESFRDVLEKISLPDLLAILLLSVLSQGLLSSSVFLIQDDYTREGLEKSVEAYFFSQALSSLPTPGGAVVSEYGLSLGLSPGYVVVYRLVYALTNIVPGLIILLKLYKGKRM